MPQNREIISTATQSRSGGTGPGICGSRYNRLVNRRRAVGRVGNGSIRRGSGVDLGRGNSGNRGGRSRGNAADDLGHRHPVGHAFAAGKVRQHYAALGDATLQLGQGIGAIVVKLPPDEVFQSTSDQLKGTPVLSLSITQTSTMAQIHENSAPYPSVRTERHSWPTPLPTYPA